MQRLIVDMGRPLETSFCTKMVGLIGKCELIPLTKNHCIFENFLLEQTDNNFYRLLEILKQYSQRAYFCNTDNELDYNLEQLSLCPRDCLISIYHPPEIVMWSNVKVKEGLWCIMPWEPLSIEDF